MQTQYCINVELVKELTFSVIIKAAIAIAMMMSLFMTIV